MSDAVEDLFATGTITVPDLKTVFGISRTVAYELMQAGRLPYTQLGRRRLVPRRAVVEMLAEGLHTGSDRGRGVPDVG